MKVLKFGGTSVGSSDSILQVKKIVESQKEKTRNNFVQHTLYEVIRVWVNAADYWDVFFYMNEMIKKEFDKQGVSIPFPQRDVHLYKAD